MNRFKQKNHRSLFRRLVPVAFFCGIIALFLMGLTSVSRITSGNEEESLKQTIIQSAVHCYATEGFYPDSITYLEDHYGLTYNKEKFVISYEVIGSNMMPDIAVIPLNKEKGA